MLSENFTEFDRAMMKEALIEAKKSFEAQEVPVGAVLTLKEKIIARSHNLVELRKDVTTHAEINVIRQAASAAGDWRLDQATLYTTLEPCVMCCGAIFLSRIKRVVWGAKDLRHGGNGSFFNLFLKKHPTHPKIEIIGGLYAGESAQLMKSFFSTKRRKN